MFCIFNFGEDADRTWKNNHSDGRIFYGYDDEENGVTDWYAEDGTLDCSTPIPTEDEQEQNDAGY